MGAALAWAKNAKSRSTYCRITYIGTYYYDMHLIGLEAKWAITTWFTVVVPLLCFIWIHFELGFRCVAVSTVCNKERNLKLQPNCVNCFLLPLSLSLSADKPSVIAGTHALTRRRGVININFGQMWNNVDMAFRYNHYSLHFGATQFIISPSE